MWKQTVTLVCAAWKIIHLIETGKFRSLRWDPHLFTWALAQTFQSSRISDRSLRSCTTATDSASNRNWPSSPRRRMGPLQHPSSSVCWMWQKRVFFLFASVDADRLQLNQNWGATEHVHQRRSRNRKKILYITAKLITLSKKKRHLKTSNLVCIDQSL